MSNAMDLLLKLDKSKLTRPKTEVEIKRLTEVVGEAFIVEVQSITGDEFEEIQNSASINADGNVTVEKHIQAKYLVKSIKSPDFNNLKIIEKFGAVSAAEAVTNLFLPGEITGLFNITNELSGFTKDAVKDLKKTLKKIPKQI